MAKLPIYMTKKYQQNNEAESHNRLKNHNTLRTRTYIEGILKHSIKGMGSHGTFRGDVEIEYSNLSVSSVFLKTLTYWKLADVVTFPESLDPNDMYITNLALSGELAVRNVSTTS